MYDHTESRAKEIKVECQMVASVGYTCFLLYPSAEPDKPGHTLIPRRFTHTFFHFLSTSCASCRVCCSVKSLVWCLIMQIIISFGTRFWYIVARTPSFCVVNREPDRGNCIYTEVIEAFPVKGVAWHLLLILRQHSSRTSRFASSTWKADVAVRKPRFDRAF